VNVLVSFGYKMFPERTADQPKVKAFRDWLLRHARETGLSG